MAAAERNKSTVAGAAGTTFAPAKPTGTVAGDILLSFLYVETVGTLTVPTGFTSVVDINNSSVTLSRLAVHRKVADGSEGATLTWSWTGSQWRVGVLIAISGADGTTPVEVSNSSNNANATGTQPPNVAVTTTTDGCLVYLAGTNSTGGVWSAATTWTLAYNSGDDIGVVRKTVSPAGDSVTNHAVLASPASNSVMSAIVAIKPAAAGAVDPYPEAFNATRRQSNPLLRMKEAIRRKWDRNASGIFCPDSQLIMG